MCEDRCVHSIQSVTNVRRSVLERVLDVVRELGGTHDLNDTLNLITQSVTDVLEFGAAAINVAEGDQVRVASVAGPPDVRSILGKSERLDRWLEMLDACEPWGDLRFLSHDRDSALSANVPTWTAPGEPAATDDPADMDGAADLDGAAGLRWHPADSLLAPMWDQQGRLVGILSVDQPRSGRHPDTEQQTFLELFAAQASLAITDARLRHEADRRREDAERRWQLTFEKSPIGAAILNTDATVSDANETLGRLVGRPREELLGRTMEWLTYPEDIAMDRGLFAEILLGTRDFYQVEKRFVHVDGHVVWGVVHVGAIRDSHGVISSIIGQLADITMRKNVEAELALRTTHDPLTRLPNRSSLETLLDSSLARRASAGVLFLDLDRFKTVNDSLGHDAGDELLTLVTGLLQACLPPEAVIGRVGGDEFAVIVSGVPEVGGLVDLALALMDALSEPIRIRGQLHTVSLSIGVTVTRPAHRHADEVLREADQAMLRAKRHGRARVEVYDPAQDKPATVADLQLEQSLRQALAHGRELMPYFQPIIGLADSRVVGFESLVRWQHPQRGLLEPAAFLPMAEKSGLIGPLGWWMLTTSCEALTDPAISDGGRRWVAVNVSGSQLGRGMLVDHVTRTLADTGLHPDNLHLEITETALIEASSVSIAEVRAVAELGVSVALDDFGTGYSSLSLLRDLPVSIVKIDRSFISPIGLDRSATAIVRRVIALCQELGITTVAEGVETQSQLTALKALGCTQAQGYLLGRPGPIEAIGSSGDAAGTLSPA